MKRALIVGSAGQDGTLLGHFLKNRGTEFCGVTRQGLASSDGKLLQAGSLLDDAFVAEMVASLAPTEIFYLAAHHHSSQDVGAGFTSSLWQESLNTQVLGLIHFLEAMRRHGGPAKLFYASSSHIFGSATTAPQSESTARAPENAYGITKLTGMEACRHYRDQGVFASVGILYNHESIYRPAKFLSQKIILAALKIREGRARELLLGDLSSRVDWGYAPDYVEAMTRILDLREPGEFVVATGEAHTVRDFVEAAFEELGLDYRTWVREDAAIVRPRAGSLVGDAAKLRAATGWQPSLAFRDMVRRLVRETRNHLAVAM